MKKIMLLGGSRYLLPVIKSAHDLGLYVITCDYLPNNIAHKYSDEYCNVSIIDKDAVLCVAQEKKIDGIMSFACDPGVVTAAYVAEKMGLPHSGSYEAVSILQNKGKFRKFLEENGFNVPTAKSYTSVEEALSDTSHFHWPVIVKPTDSAGSKGVSKVVTPEELREKIEYALMFSHSNEFIIEDFLEKKGASSDSDSFSVDGKLEFVSFSAQRFDEKCENPYTPAAYSWPSTISLEHQEELKSEIQRLLSLLKMKTSIYNIEVRECTNGKAYIMECSPRGGGNRLSEMLRYATGVDLIANSVRAAVGMPVAGILQKNCDEYWAEIILHSEKAGVFKGLKIDQNIPAEIVEQDLWISIGDKVGGFSGANEAIGTIVLKFKKNDDMTLVMNCLKTWIQVVVE